MAGHTQTTVLNSFSPSTHLLIEDTGGHHDSPHQPNDGRTARNVQVKTRRKRYLDLHPEYFTDDSRELADPLLYDRLVRRFMTAEEREIQGRDRGFASMLEANLARSEAKLEALEHPDLDDPLVYVRAGDGSISGVEQDEDARPKNKEDAWERWKEYVSQKFMTGHDLQVDYAAIDDDEELDDHAEEDRGRLERYMDEEDERFIGDGTPQGETGIQDF